jgi:homoserine kinase
VSTDQLAAVGAFLSGAGSVITAWFYVKWQRKNWDKECNQRLEAFKAGLHEMERHEKNS